MRMIPAREEESRRRAYRNEIHSHRLRRLHAERCRFDPLTPPAAMGDRLLVSRRMKESPCVGELPGMEIPMNVQFLVAHAAVVRRARRTVSIMVPVTVAFS